MKRYTRPGIWILLTLFALWAVACTGSTVDISGADGDDDPDGDGAADGDGEEAVDGDDVVLDGDVVDKPLSDFNIPIDFLTQDVDWVACPLNEDSLEGDGECADIEVPLFWDDPKEENISLRIKRLKVDGAKRQLWLLSGGPGYSGTVSYGQWMNSQGPDSIPETDFYALDHRGTGRSTRMGCPNQEAEDSEFGVAVSQDEYADCADYYLREGFAPEAFNVTQAAIDVGAVAELLKENEKELFVMGVSYGTYWAHRYTQLFPLQPVGVIFDSVAPSDRTFFDLYDIEADVTMKTVMDLCAEDPVCGEKLGEDPYQVSLDALNAFRNGSCPELSEDFGITPEHLQMLGANIARNWYGRVMVPAIFHRLERCEPDDVRIIYNALVVLMGTKPPTASDRMYSTLLADNISISEMISPDAKTAAQMTELYLDMLVSSRVAYNVLTKIGLWPAYDHDQYVYEWAAPEVPILMLNGGLDMQTPIDMAQRAGEMLTGENQFFIEIPFGNHGVTRQSPVMTEDAEHCGTQILLSYLDDPQAEPDISCLNDLEEPDFAGYPEYTEYYFNSPDMWENVPLDLECGVADEFYISFADNYLSFNFSGRINDISDIRIGMGDFTLVLDGENINVDSWASYTYTTVISGFPVMMIQSLGNLVNVDANHVTYHLSRMTIPDSLLKEMKGGDVNLSTLADGGILVETIESEEKDVGAKHYTKLCQASVTDTSFDAQNSFFLCHEDNETFSTGEKLKAAANVGLTTDADKLAACFCYEGQGTPVDCDDFDALDTSGGSKSLKKYRLPRLMGLTKPDFDLNIWRSSRPIDLSPSF